MAINITLEMVLEKLKVAHGSWQATGSGNTHYTGMCQKCLRRQPAINLQLVRLPFGRGESWVCGNCVNAPKE